MITMTFENGLSVAADRDKEGYLAIVTGGHGATTHSFDNPADLVEFFVRTLTSGVPVPIVESENPTVSWRIT